MTLTDVDLHKIRAAVAEAGRARHKVDRLVVEMRSKGATWTEIGFALGMTAQGAQKRYSPDGRERAEAQKEEQAAKALRRRARAKAAADPEKSPRDGVDAWPDGTVQETLPPE